MITISKYNDIYDIAKISNNFIINLSNLSIKDKIRTIDFLTGLTIKKGSIVKISSSVFKISI